MSRLIDANALKKHITSYVSVLAGDFYVEIGAILRAIEEQPTTYDIGEVVEQLEKDAYLTADWVYGGTMTAVNLTDAIEIVKGGTNNDY